MDDGGPLEWEAMGQGSLNSMVSSCGEQDGDRSLTGDKNASIVQ
jgi:hypothetical protein